MILLGMVVRVAMTTLFVPCRMVFWPGLYQYMLPCMDISEQLQELATAFHALGELSEARSYLERVLTLREQILGPLHKDTMTALESLVHACNIPAGDTKGAH